MSKIYEVDFTATGTNMIDSVSGISTPYVVTNPVRIVPLPGFNVRPGRYYNAAANGTTLPTPVGDTQLCRFKEIPITRSRKSFLMWLYTTGAAQPTTYESSIWADNSSTLGATGWSQSTTSSGSLQFRTDSTVRGVVTPTGVMNKPGWHMITATIDTNTTSGGTKVYYNKGLYLTYSGYPSSAASITETTIKLPGPTLHAEALFEVGLLTIYDHILSQTEINNLYDTFLPDTLSQTPFLISVSGVVVGVNNTPISGAFVGVFNHDSRQLESLSDTDANGNYKAYFSTKGNYTMFSSHPPTNSGGRAIPVIVSSGGTVTFYD